MSYIKRTMMFKSESELLKEAEARIAELEGQIHGDRLLLMQEIKSLEASLKYAEDQISKYFEPREKALEAENAKLRHDLEHLLGLPVVDKEAGE